MPQQLDFVLVGDEYNEIKDIVKRCYLFVRKKYKIVEGESLEDYNSFIRDETLLEIANRLEEIATRRQRLNINLMDIDKKCF